MKKFRVIQAILVLFSAIAFTSCDDEITLDPLTGGFSDSDMRVAFDNQMFVAEEVGASAAGGAITITGTSELGEIMTITLNQTQVTLSDLETGNTTPYNNVSMTYMSSETGGQEYVNVSPDGETTGTIVITELDIANRTISGNFAFVGYDPDNATAEPMAFYTGSFSNVSYTGTLPAPIPAVPNPTPSTEYLKAKIDGTLVEFGLISAMPASGDIILSGGTTSPLTGLSITVDAAILPGTYSFATSPVDGAYAVYNANNMAHVSQSGTLTIISNADGYIKGTFSFTATGGETTVEVTEGEFNISLN